VHRLIAVLVILLALFDMGGRLFIVALSLFVIIDMFAASAVIERTT
jgi:hypothetical protein